MRQLKVLTLYPTLMNIYADRGNLLTLQRRCQWRGIDFVNDGVGIGESFDPEGYSLIYIGGGQDRDQRLCAEDLVKTKGAPLRQAVTGGSLLLGICGGYQLLGESYQLGDQQLPGLGLVGVKTVREDGPRIIGNVTLEVELDQGDTKLLTGFENHGGRTYLSADENPLGRVVKGGGNNGKDGFEGVYSGNIIGTYLHGPLLPKNVWFADWLIARALGVKQLEPLADDLLEIEAHRSALKAAGTL